MIYWVPDRQEKVTPNTNHFVDDVTLDTIIDALGECTGSTHSFDMYLNRS